MERDIHYKILKKLFEDALTTNNNKDVMNLSKYLYELKTKRDQNNDKKGLISSIIDKVFYKPEKKQVKEELKQLENQKLNDEQKIYVDYLKTEKEYIKQVEKEQKTKIKDDNSYLIKREELIYQIITECGLIGCTLNVEALKKMTNEQLYGVLVELKAGVHGKRNNLSLIHI